MFFFSLLKTSRQQAKIEKLKKWEDDLNRREANLDQRQEILTEREKDQVDPRAPNWPIFYPLVYQNLVEDPKTPELRTLIRIAYICWMISAGAFLWNFICALSVLIVSGGGISDFILSIIYAVFLIPIDFLHFRILYRACRKPKAITFVFFWCFWWPFEICGFAFFGIGYFGGIGLYQIAFGNLYSDSIVVGVMATISMVVWWVLAIIAFFIFVKSRIEYGKVGGLAAAKKQAATAAINQAKEHPELIKAAAVEAAKHPDLVVKGVTAASQV